MDPKFFRLSNNESIELLDFGDNSMFLHVDAEGHLLKELHGEYDDLRAMFDGVQHGDLAQLTPTEGETYMAETIQDQDQNPTPEPDVEQKAEVASDDVPGDVPNNTGAQAVQSQETPSKETMAAGDLQTATPAPQVDTTGEIPKVTPVEISPGFMNPNASRIPEQNLPNEAKFTRQASPDRTN